MASNSGVVSIRLVDWAKVDAGDSEGLNTVYKKITKIGDEWIEFMSYSPNEKYLAVGSHDNLIYLLDVEKDYEMSHKLKAHSSFITAFDWS